MAVSEFGSLWGGGGNITRFYCTYHNFLNKVAYKLGLMIMNT